MMRLARSFNLMTSQRGGGYYTRVLQRITISYSGRIQQSLAVYTVLWRITTYLFLDPIIVVVFYEHLTYLTTLLS